MASKHLGSIELCSTAKTAFLTDLIPSFSSHLVPTARQPSSPGKKKKILALRHCLLTLAEKIGDFALLLSSKGIAIVTAHALVRTAYLLYPYGFHKHKPCWLSEPGA